MCTCVDRNWHRPELPQFAQYAVHVDVGETARLANFALCHRQRKRLPTRSGPSHRR